jgi:stalled ribosome rescue protein Dom34
MKKEAGLWIDHRQAVIVTLVDQMEEIKRITSDIEKQVRYSGASHGSHDETTEIRRDRQDRRFDDHLSKYYDEVIACLRDADSILIFGPGEAKGELQKQLEGQALGERIVGIETTDKMTDDEVAAKVRKYFQG